MTSFALPELHTEVRSAALRFAREVLSRHAEAIDGGEPVPEAIQGQLAELGFWGIATAEERGGIGLDALAYALVVEALASGSPSVARRVAVHAGPALAGLARTERDLEPFCGGEAFATYVDGLSPAPAALYVTADGVAEEASVDAVDPMGHRGAGLARVTVGALTPFASEGAAPAVWHDLGLAAVALGSARAATDAAIAYGKERRQFGRPITDFQAIQWKIADAVTAIEGAALLVHRAAATLAPSHAALARAVAVRAGLVATDHALQIHGGYGYTREYPVERHLRSVRMVGGVDAARVTVAADRLAG
jgi:alkylation response protein AidB-like acyl-CoA dehydrogenase